MSKNVKKYKIKYILDKVDSYAIVSKRKKISSTEIEILYENDIWDGPLEGMCLWNGQEYFFIYIHSDKKITNGTNSPRKYLLIKLNEEQFSNEKLLREKFIKYVESYPYVTEGKISYRKNAEWDKYHNASNKYPDQEISENQIVGWFEL